MEVDVGGMIDPLHPFPATSAARKHIPCASDPLPLPSLRLLTTATSVQANAATGPTKMRPRRVLVQIGIRRPRHILVRLGIAYLSGLYLVGRERARENVVEYGVSLLLL